MENQELRSNLLKSQILISDLEQGMTVEHNGELVTVSKKYIGYNDLFGYSFRGDFSNKYLTRIQFLVPTLFGISIR